MGEKADLAQARGHLVHTTQQASQVRQLGLLGTELLAEVCPCCGLPGNAPQFSLTCAISELNELGAGFSLYFYFVQNSVLIAALVIVRY